MRSSYPFSVTDPLRNTPSWLAPRSEGDIRELRWSAAPEAKLESIAPRFRSRRPPSLVVPENVEVSDVRVPTPPALPTFDAAELEREIASIAEQFTAATTTLQDQFATLREQLRVECEQEAIKLAFLVAERIVHGEITCQPELALSWAREGARSIASGSPPEIRLGPHLAQLLLESGISAPGVVADNSLGDCDVRVVGPDSFVDAGLTTRLQALFEAMQTEDLQ